MKLSAETLAILKNFSTINSTIHIKKGNVLSVLHGEDVFAKATVSETFPCAVRIYDLNQVLASLGLVGNAELEIGEKSLKISGGSSTLEYVYADPYIVKETPDIKGIVDRTVLTCSLTNKILEAAQRFALLFSINSFSIVGESGKAMLLVGSTKSHNYKYDIGVCTDDFEYKFSLDSLKLLNDTYEMSLGSRGTGKEASGLMKLKGNTIPVEYLMAATPDSKL